MVFVCLFVCCCCCCLFFCCCFFFVFFWGAVIIYPSLSIASATFSFRLRKESIKIALQLYLAHGTLENRSNFFLLVTWNPPKGGQGCLMSPPFLESQGCHLIPLYNLLSFFFCVVLLLFLSYLFFCLLVHSPELFPENSSIFLVHRCAFLYGSCLAARRSKLVGGMCSMLPYGAGICRYAFIYYFFFVASVHCFFKYFLKSGMDKSMKWSTIPACPSLMCFFNRGNTEGTNSSKMLRLMFVYVLLYV